jgi:hypothetical protein
MDLPDCVAGKNRHCEEEVLGAGPAGCEHLLDHDAELGRVTSPALAEPSGLRSTRPKMERLGRVLGVLEREESAGRTTKPKPPSESWNWSKTRRAARLLLQMVEAVGIEPTSGNPRQQASTSLAGYLVRLASRPPNRPGHRLASS